jgi:chromosome segregation ATPase
MPTISTYDASRDPRINHQPSDIQMANAEPADSSRPTEPQALEDQVRTLRTTVASQGAEIAKLQRKKTSVKFKLHDTHMRLVTITKTHETLTTSHAKRVEEKGLLISENIEIEQRLTGRIDKEAEWLRCTSEMENKILLLETQIQRLEADNEDRWGRTMELEREKHELLRQIEELEAEKEKRGAPEDVTHDGMKDRSQNTGRRRRDSYASRYNAVEEDQRLGGEGDYGRGDSYRPDHSFSGRFGGGRQPPSGSKGERHRVGKVRRGGA